MGAVPPLTRARWTSTLLWAGVALLAVSLVVSLPDGIMRRGSGAFGLAEILALPGYLLLCAAILTGFSATGPVPSRFRAVADRLMVMTAAAGFSWYFLVGPWLLNHPGSTSRLVAAVLYPLGDLALAYSLLILAGGVWDRSLQRPALLLAPGLALILVCDSVQAYWRLHGGSMPDALLNTGAVAGYLLVAVAGFLFPGVSDSSEPAAAPPELALLPPSMPRVWRYLLPYACIPAVIGLAIYAARLHGDHRLEVGVYAAGALLVELVFLHVTLTYKELIAYANRSARLESQAAADPVTGLPNHRSMVAQLDRELERCRRYGRACTILFLDLDHFKALNDSLGHSAGDAALREFGAVVRTALRITDVLGRWGGEEFVAILPETDVDEALAVAERIRVAVAEHPFWSASGVHITCSIGVAVFPHDAETRDHLVEQADRAMYTAKRLGRNLVHSVRAIEGTEIPEDEREVGSREEAALLGTVEALSALVEVRDGLSSQQLQAVSALATQLALSLGLDTSEAHMVGLATRLRDIGKVAVPDAVLQKAGGLTGEEWDVVRSHPEVGAAVVSRVPALKALAPIIRLHHERWDGSGYPDRLVGEEVPLTARILNVADSYQAMITPKPYRSARTSAEALSEIEHHAGSQYDPAVVKALREVLQR